MRPADAYRLKYRSGTAEGQTLEPNDESNTALVDSERVLKRSRTLRRCEECKSAVTAQTIVKTEQKAGLAAFIHT